MRMIPEKKSYIIHLRTGRMAEESFTKLRYCSHFDLLCANDDLYFDFKEINADLDIVPYMYICLI